MARLPRSIVDSGAVDGASHWQTFGRLVMPLSLPALASVAVFQFLTVWNHLWSRSRSLVRLMIWGR